MYEASFLIALVKLVLPHLLQQVNIKCYSIMQKKAAPLGLRPQSTLLMPISELCNGENASILERCWSNTWSK